MSPDHQHDRELPRAVVAEVHAVFQSDVEIFYIDDTDNIRVIFTMGKNHLTLDLELGQEVGASKKEYLLKSLSPDGVHNMFDDELKEFLSFGRDLRRLRILEIRLSGLFSTLSTSYDPIRSVRDATEVLDDADGAQNNQEIRGNRNSEEPDHGMSLEYESMPAAANESFLPQVGAGELEVAEANAALTAEKLSLAALGESNSGIHVAAVADIPTPVSVGKGPYRARPLNSPPQRPSEVPQGYSPLRTMFRAFLAGAVFTSGAFVAHHHLSSQPNQTVTAMPVVPRRQPVQPRTSEPVIRPTPIPRCNTYTVVSTIRERGVLSLLRRMEREHHSAFTTYRLVPQQLQAFSIRPRHQAEAAAHMPTDPRHSLGEGARYRFGKVIPGDTVTLQICPDHSLTFTHTRANIGLYSFSLR